MRYSYFIYQHFAPDSQLPFYIGKGKKNQNEYSRANSKRNRNTYWHNIVNKNGYVVTISHKNICNEEACVIEKYLIDFYGRRDLKKGCLVNMTDGGEGSVNYKHSEEAKIKIGEKSLGRNIGEKNPMYGKKLSEEHRKKLSEAAMKANVSRVVSEDSKKKISESLKKYFSENPEKKLYLSTPEKRIKHSIASKGRVLTEEWKRKISETKKRKNAI
jgi:hypothetical protein